MRSAYNNIQVQDSSTSGMYKTVESDTSVQRKQTTTMHEYLGENKGEYSVVGYS